MKNIQYYKIFESRTASIGESEFKSILKNKCSDFLKSPMLIQRNKKIFDSNFSYINPKITTRTPLTNDLGDGEFNEIGVSSRHHTLLMDNLPSWKEFPKRSNCVIGLSNVSIDTTFGSYVYFIIPYDGAIFGMSPGEDLWDSTNNDMGIGFNDDFCEVFIHARISDNNYEKMLKDLGDVYEEYITDSLPYQIPVMLTDMFDTFDKQKDFESQLSEYFSPNNFSSVNSRNYKTFSYNELQSREPSKIGNMLNIRNEVWTESECLIVYIGRYDFSTRKEIWSDFTNILNTLIS